MEAHEWYKGLLTTLWHEGGRCSMSLVGKYSDLVTIYFRVGFGRNRKECEHFSRTNFMEMKTTVLASDCPTSE
ncbi:hypothetical protein NC652_016925 [Populus alba x Populus x berolinensis]|nr:hypothetical protein NC651_016411 [Populus alba x Populus x berolinensis]KAJ6923442.1 hypothetical protein NC652_016925 [Populus alba x Populus x berolinensis]